MLFFVCVNSICDNRTQSPLRWLGSEQQLQVLRAGLPSGHLPSARGVGIRRTLAQEPHPWDLAGAVGASIAGACAMLICANKNIHKISLRGKSLKYDSYFKCIPMGTSVLNYAGPSGTHKFH